MITKEIRICCVVVRFLASMAAVIMAFGIAYVGAQEFNPDFYKSIPFRHIGPQGKRVVAVAGIPGDSNTIYAGAASGGVFKTLDGGVHWIPIFDGFEVQSIGAIAVAHSDPNIVWVVTGEAFIRGNISIGNGVYRSTDAGKTWAYMGLIKTGRIARVVIDPVDPDLVYVAAMGHCYGPQEERGIFRTTDGGKTWERILFVDEDTGASELVMDPGNPRILFTGMWQLVIKGWGRQSGGLGSGIFISRDRGLTWKRTSRSQAEGGAD